MKIKYTITFLSEWHAGSGLSSGAAADAVVIKDKNNLPYLPGKTVKGLLKDVFEDFVELGALPIPTNFVHTYFGNYDEDSKQSKEGALFFSNAELSDDEKREITTVLSDYLYRNTSSTKINKNGVTEHSSLRSMEVCVPLTLHGYIDAVKEGDRQLFEKAFKYLRHIGANRNRGLGRCKFELKAN